MSESVFLAGVHRFGKAFKGEQGDRSHVRLKEEQSRTLREEFASLVRNRDFKTAMRKGEEIVDLFPDSRMTADYKSILRHLQRREQQAESAAADAR